MRPIAVVLAVLLGAVSCGDDGSSGQRTVSSTTTTAGNGDAAAVEPVALAGADSGVDMSEVQDQLPVNTGRRPLPPRVGDLEVWNDKVADLSDGRSLVLGRWLQDDPLETWSVPLSTEGPGERVDRSDRPIRLFVVDWETDAVTPVSAIPDSHVLRTATGEHMFFETVLEFDVESDERTVRYTAGWNGAGYDVPYSLWLAPIPPA